MASVQISGVDGITPACAGKSGKAEWPSPVNWDHPRVCGEKWPNRISCWLAAGITPACAGKRLKKALKNKDF